MSVNEVLNGIGSWSIGFRDRLPDEIAQALQFFGHVAVIEGSVNVELTGDSLLPAARYVGVLKSRDLATGRTIGGDSMEQWLGDEDDKGAVFETAIVKTNGTLGQWLASILPVAVHLGTVHDPGTTWSGKIQWVSPRTALQTVCDAFSVTYRVNGDATLDVGTAAQLYRTVPRTNDVDPIIIRNGAGVDLDVAALGGTPDVADDVRDYSSRIVLVGQTQDDGNFAVGTQDAPSVPYVDRWGNVVQRTRLISETGTETGSIASRTQLQLNRYNRIVRALKVTGDDYEIAGNVRVGDTVWIYDPDAGIVNPANEVVFRGEVLHPDKIGVTGLSWPVVEGMTVAYRAPNGTWYDLTPFVTYETSAQEVSVGDLPRSLTTGVSNPVIDRQDSAPDTIAPSAPTGLALTTTSVLDAKGGNAADITAAWTAPTTSVDGSALADLAYYIVQWRPQFRAPQWQATTYSETPQITLPAVIGLMYDVQVAAVDRSQNISAFTAVASILTAIDTIAPNAPADPTVGNYIGQLRIAYAGTDNLGQPMPADAQRIDVEVASASGGPYTVVSQLDPRVPGKAYVDAPYGSTRYVRLRAYDNAQNGSAYSGVISGATAQAADGDIASMNIGKLLAGTIGVDVVIATRLTTALTGQRAEHNAAGFQVWNAAGTKVVDLNGTANLMTGIFQTDLAGNRRIVIGAAGAAGEIDFFAPDGTKAIVKAWTESTGLEAIQFGVPITGVSGSLWNRINYNNDGPGWANYRANNHEFHIGGINSASGSDSSRPGSFSVWHTGDYGVTNQARLNIGSSGETRWESNGRQTYSVDAGGVQGFWGTSGWQGSAYYPSSHLELTGPPLVNLSSVGTWYTPPQPGTGLIYGGKQFFAMDAPGVNQRFEFEDWSGSVYIALWAGAFTVPSVARDKTLLGELDDAMTSIRGSKVHVYRRHLTSSGRASGRKQADAPVKDLGPVEIGLYAEEAPEQVVTFHDDGTPHGVDLYQMSAMEWRAIQQIDARLSALEKGSSS